MSNISITSRPHSQDIKFVDGYRWEVDPEGNHRLVNDETDSHSKWVPALGVSVLDDKMVVDQAYSGILPIRTLLLWQRLRTA